MESVQQACVFEYQVTRRYPYIPLLRRHIRERVCYLRYLPKTYADEPSWPLILFLHGADERGNDLEMVKRNGPPKLIHEGQEFPFIIISPQCRSHRRWDIEMLGKLLDEVESNYRVDADRIYVTGISMGGGAVWKLSIKYPQRFAAIVPVSGRSMPKYAATIKHLPVWVFHGAKDTIVPPRESTAIVDALRSCGNNVRFTLYQDANHDCWTETYANPQLYNWLLTIRRGMSAISPAAEPDGAAHFTLDEPFRHDRSY